MYQQLNFERTFYQFKGDLDQLKKDAVKHSYFIRLEEKYKDNTNRRKETEKHLEDILKMCQSPEDVKIVDYYDNIFKEQKFEITFIKDFYFAWCEIHYDRKDYFINTYNLEKL
jgi:hypothetical protein